MCNQISLNYPLIAGFVFAQRQTKQTEFLTSDGRIGIIRDLVMLVREAKGSIVKQYSKKKLTD